jgi:hypothetical protein
MSFRTYIAVLRVVVAFTASIGLAGHLLPTKITKSNFKFGPGSLGSG